MHAKRFLSALVGSAILLLDACTIPPGGSRLPEAPETANHAPTDVQEFPGSQDRGLCNNLPDPARQGQDYQCLKVYSDLVKTPSPNPATIPATPGLQRANLPPASPVPGSFALPGEKPGKRPSAVDVDPPSSSKPVPLPEPASREKPARAARPGPPQNPTQLLREAQQAALVSPSPRGYFGGSAVHKYVWVPNKLFMVYVTKTNATKIVLPPGERLVVGLALDPEAFEVGTARVGSELQQQDVIFVRPLHESGEVDVSALTESGHSFDLHLIVGKVGMFAVTFEVPPIVQVNTDDDLPIPRR